MLYIVMARTTLMACGSCNNFAQFFEFMSACILSVSYLHYLQLEFDFLIRTQSLHKQLLLPSDPSSCVRDLLAKFTLIFSLIANRLTKILNYKQEVRQLRR